MLDKRLLEQVAEELEQAKAAHTNGQGTLADYNMAVHAFYAFCEAAQTNPPKNNGAGLTADDLSKVLSAVIDDLLYANPQRKPSAIDVFANQLITAIQQRDLSISEGTAMYEVNPMLTNDFKKRMEAALSSQGDDDGHIAELKEGAREAWGAYLLGQEVTSPDPFGLATVGRHLRQSISDLASATQNEDHRNLLEVVKAEFPIFVASRSTAAAAAR